MSDFLTALRISGSGLAAQRTRVNVAASNLANAESTRGPDGTMYKRRDAVLAATPFESTLQEANGTGQASQPQGVKVAEIVEDQGPGKKVYMPSHPDSDSDGFVTFPDVNPIHETVNLLTASRGYEANASAVDTLKSMAQRAIDIGR